MSTNSEPPKPPAWAALYAKAMRHLARKCPVMKTLVARVGPCTWTPVSDDPFTLLVRCVISQQISTKAAVTIFDRLAATAGGMPIAPHRLAALTEADFKTCGVSGPKQRTLRAIIAHTTANPDLLSEIEDRADEVLRTQLMAITGIGPWSADIFLMFAISRADVLPVGDLGLKVGVKRLFQLAELPKPAELETIAEKWKPYRSVATWYIWRSLDLTSDSGEQQ